jgi:hypothetical protein
VLLALTLTYASCGKQECIIASCLDPGQGRRDLEHLLQTISMTVMSDLAR